MRRRAATARPGSADARQSRCPPSTAASATTRARSLQSQGTRQRGQHPCGRALPRRPGRARKAGGSPIEAPPTGKRVLVVGAGPSGLSAAYHLARLGHEVEIHEAGPLPGGMLHFGIPAYRLPRDELMKEVARIEEMGVKIVLNHKVEDLPAEMADGAFRCGVRRDRRARREARRHPGARRRPRARRSELPARRQHRRGAAARPPGRRSTAAATPRWTPRGRPGASAPKRR